MEKVINREAMANPGCLDWYVRMAAARTWPEGVRKSRRVTKIGAPGADPGKRRSLG
jgi:hypothetical protein